MSRVQTWVLLSAAGLCYWGAVKGFHPSSIEHFAGPVWFGGMALFVHWVFGPPTSPTTEGGAKP